jgi:centrosomal protein CEP104
MQPNTTSARFAVHFASSAEEKFPASELEKSLLASRGWQSARSATFPQVLILDLGKTCDVAQLQVLAHECKTATRIEVFLSNERVPETAEFEYVGYMAFQHNRDAVYKSGQLKTCRLAKRCTLIKLVVLEPHENQLNFFGQVGIHAVIVVRTSETGEDRGEEQWEHSRVDSIAMDLKYDRHVYARIRELERAKELAVSEERFGLAATLKQRIDILIPIAQHLRTLEMRKNAATMEEDYQMANLLKAEIGELRSQAMAESMVAEVHLHPPTYSAHDPSSRQPAPSRIAAITVDHQPAEPGKSFDDVPAVNPRFGHDAGAREDLAPAGPAPQDSAVLLGDSGLSDKDREVAACIAALTSEGPPEDSRAAMRESSQFTELLSVFATYLPCCLVSKRYVLREAGSETLRHKADTLFAASDANIVLRGVFTFLTMQGYGLSDKVASVFLAAWELLASALNNGFHGDCDSALKMHGTPLLKCLVLRIGDGNEKIRVAACTALKQMMSRIAVDTVASLIINGRHAQAHRAWVSRLEIVGHAISLKDPRDALDTGLLNFQSLMSTFIVKGLEHAHKDVRDRAVDLLCSLVSRVGRQAILDSVAKLRPALRQAVLTRLDSAPEESGPEVAATVTPPAPLKSRREPERPQRDSEAHDATPAPESRGHSSPPESKGSPALVHAAAAPPSTYARRLQPQPIPGRCQFCEMEDPEFTDHSELVQHFHAECPMLCNCPFCQLPVEIREINDHLVEDCERRSRVSRCPRCRCAVRLDAFDAHVTAKKCPPFDPDTVVCPLCATRLPNIDSFWFAHVMHPPYCSGNTRSFVD